MRVLRGRAPTIEVDYRVTASLFERSAAARAPAVRVWQPHRQIAFGRRDAAADGYDDAREVAIERGFEPVEREVGGRAVAYTGSTIAFARVVPLDDQRTGLDERYESMTADVRRALGELGVDAQRGEPADSFCPGAHSLRAAGKLVGIAQRVKNDAALVSGIAIVRDHDDIATVLDPVYDKLGVPFAPQSVGSIAKAGGRSDPTVVRAALEDALCGTSQKTVETVDSDILSP